MQRQTVTRLASHWAIVLVTLAAWILLSNHCALGLSGLVASSATEPGVCPMHSGPVKEKPATNIPCCKDLRAVVSHAVKNLGAVASQWVGVRAYVAAVFTLPRVAAQLAASDTGPPNSISFAESILQRSILAHAPPVDVSRV
jgi:hypothetical protein